MQNLLRNSAIVLGFTVPFWAVTVALAEKPKVTAEQALKLEPTQAGIDYDRVEKPADVKNCEVESSSIGGLKAIIVKSAGVTLRQFIDSNGDGNVDEWCYFKDGIEIYRDMDTNANNKVDQCRWLGTAGTRWGMDADEDGRIDNWKIISAEEVTAELIAAIREKDATRFRRLLISREELESLGLGAKQLAEFKAKITAAEEQFDKKVGQQKTILPRTDWLRFDAQLPGVIPAGANDASKDITIYDNVSALVETTVGKEKRPAQFPIGSLVKIGNGWRLLDLPTGLTAEGVANARGQFFKASLPKETEGETPSDAANVSAELRKLYDDLNILDKKLAAAKNSDEARKINDARGELLESIIQATTGDDKVNWIKQYAEGISAAVASRTCPDGVERLNKLLASVDRSAATRGLAPYITFRKLQAEKDIEFQKDEPDSEKIAASWKALEAFVDEYPKSEDAAEAMLQLGIEQEFAGRPKAAAEWFGRIVKDHPGSPQASKAAGAKLRLESVGKPITFRGKSIDEKGEVSLTQLSGKVVVIHYWTTWCEVCKKDMETLKQLHSKYGKTGFQPIGVNLDNDKTEAISFLKENRLPWPQLFEPGGQEKSRLANDLGVHTLPTMILIDKHGKLISGNIHAGGLEAELKKLLK